MAGRLTMTLWMWYAWIVVLMVVRGGSAAGGDFDWCKHNCGREMHTMCKYEQGGGPQCSRYRMGLTKGEQQAIVELHNHMRATVANGYERRGIGGEQPTASDMMELVWDDEVAMIAQRWADQCRTRGHDSCTKTMAGVSLGQNVGGMSGSGMNPPRQGMISERITAWYDEVAEMVTSDVDSVFRSSTGMVGHYTQLVWARSSRIGCGLAHLNAGSFAVKLVCSYKPAGNVGNLRIYTRGDPATKCPKNSEPSRTYRGLCKSDGNEVYDDPTGMGISDMMAGFPLDQSGFSSFPTDSQDFGSFGGGLALPPAFGQHPIHLLMGHSLFPQSQPISAMGPSSPSSRPRDSNPASISPPKTAVSPPLSDIPDVIIEIPMSPRSY